MPIGDDNKAPYAPADAIVTVLEGYRERGLQTPFTADVLMRAGVTESLAPRTLQSLRLLDLIDDDGEPTPEMVDLKRVPSVDYQDRLAAVLYSAYAPIFSFVDPTQDSQDRVEDAFRPFEPEGQRSRMVTLFLGLCAYAGITDAEAPQPNSKKRTRRRKPTTPKDASPKPSPRPPAEKVVHASPQGTAVESPRARLRTAILDIAGTIPDSTHWTADERERYLNAFTAVVDLYIGVKNSEAPNRRAGASDVLPREGDSDGTAS